MNPLNEKANTLSRCGSFYYRTIVDESKAEAEFVSHLPSLTRLVPLGNKISTAIQGGCYYQDYYKLIKFTDADIDWNGVKEALQKRVRGGMGVITDKLEQISASKARELGTQAWELLEEDLPKGLKRIIELKMQVLNTAPIEEPVYLQVFHTTYSNETPINTLIATSTTAINVVAGQVFAWKFDDLLLGTALLTNNSKISFQFTKNAASTWQDADSVPHNIVVGVGSYVPSVQFWRLAAPEQSMPTFNRPAHLTIEDHFFAGDDKWNWISREGTPQPIAFPGGESSIVLPESQELIWDLHIDKDIMVTSIRKDDGTILYANQDFASQFGKLTFLQNPIALFPKMQFMAQSYTGRIPNLYNYLARVDNVYGSIARVIRYMRGSQSIKSLYYASAQAAGLTVVEQDCTVVAVSPLLDGKAYITTAGRYDAAYPHTPLKVGTKFTKDYIIGGNQLYRLIGPYDPMPSNITGINLGTALPVPGLFAPNKSIRLTDKSGSYAPMYEGDASAIKAYHNYIKETGMPMDVLGAAEYSDMVSHTALLAACQLLTIKDAFADTQYKEGDTASIIKIPYYKAYGMDFSRVPLPPSTSSLIERSNKLIDLKQQNSTARFTVYGCSLPVQGSNPSYGGLAFDMVDCTYTTKIHNTLQPDYEALWYEVANKLLASNVFSNSINTPVLGVGAPVPTTAEIKGRSYGNDRTMFSVHALFTAADYTSDLDINNSCLVVVNNAGSVTLHAFTYHFKRDEYLYCSGHLVVTITGLEISDLVAECEVADSNGDTILYGQSLPAENGMQHFRYTACPNRCVVACINEGYMTTQMKLRLMTYLQRELPIGSVLVTANLPNIINETPELTNKDIMDNFNILPFLHLDDRHYVKTNLVFDTAYSYDIEVKAYYGQFTPRYANVLGGVNVPTDGIEGYTPARCIGGASTYGFTYNKNYQLLITRPADAIEAGNELVYRMTQKTDDITTIEIGDQIFNLDAGTLQLVDAASPYLPAKGGVPEEQTYWIGMLHSAEGTSGFRSNAYHVYWKFIDPATNELVLDLVPAEHKLTKQQGFMDMISKTFYPSVSITED